jgi:hypothetical protein
LTDPDRDVVTSTRGRSFVKGDETDEGSVRVRVRADDGRERYVEATVEQRINDGPGAVVHLTHDNPNVQQNPTDQTSNRPSQ